MITNKRCTRLLWVLLFGVLVSGLSPVFAQVDTLSFDTATGVLSYEMDYDRAAENAEARGCEQATFESGVVHSLLRNLFLYLPLEASYRDGVGVVEVRVVSEDDLVMYGAAPLDSLRQTNSQFRVFMNSFASTRAGTCFALSRATLSPWISTLTARGGQFALDQATVALDIEALDIAEISPLQVAAETEPSVEPEPAIEAAEDTVIEAAPAEALAPQRLQAAPAELQDTTIDEVATPTAEVLAAPTGEYILTPFLTDERVTEFDGPRAVIDPTKDYAALVETTRGQFFIDLFEEQAPRTVNNFVFLALNRFYDGVLFHRVIDDFMAQTGDPLGSGAGGPGYQFADEITPGFAHSGAGVVSMANAGPNTNGSQFFITLAATPWLDGNHSIFGAVIDGMDVLPELNRTDPNQPIAVATPDSTLGLLETQGVDFAGADQMAISDYLTESLGALPPDGERVTLADYDVLFATDPQTEERLIAFWPASDRIENVYILERQK